MKIPMLIILSMCTWYSDAQNIMEQKARYLQESQSFRKSALICLGFGAASIAAGQIIPRGSLVPGSYQGGSTGGSGWISFDPRPETREYENTFFRKSLTVAGSVAVITSLFQFGSSSRYKRKAMNLAVKYEPGSILLKNEVASIHIPSLSLKFNF